MFRLGDAELLVALVRAGDRDRDHLVWLGVRTRDAQLAVRIVRRIHHRQHDVDAAARLLPVLPHLERRRHRRHQAEDVRRRAHAELVDPRLRFLEVRRERVRLGHVRSTAGRPAAAGSGTARESGCSRTGFRRSRASPALRRRRCCSPRARGDTGSPRRCPSCRARSSRRSCESSTPDARAPSPNP